MSTVRSYIELAVEVEFDYHAAERQASDCPGSDASIEITAVRAVNESSEAVFLRALSVPDPKLAGVDIMSILTKEQLAELEDDIYAALSREGEQ